MVSFGSCGLDLAARELWRDGERVHLEPKAFDVLAFLVQQRARVVPNAEILDAVWGDQFVSESALTTRIKEIRQAVGDDGARQEVVANVRRRGYRFVAEVSEGRVGAEPATQAPAIVGRSRDLADVMVRLRPGVAVSLVGPGGVGKTTLARAVSRSLVPPPADGVIVVELAEVAEPAAVVAAVARAAGVAADATDAGLLARTLAPLDSLLVLDSCEHVVVESARLVTRLLDAGGRLRVLVTSRERLGVAGEVVWPLLPLERGDAVELFLRRARAAAPGFSAEGAEDDLHALLAGLDDLPLAIEMAAARVTSSSVAELRAEVGADRSGLRSPDRSSAARHRTLADLVSWSARSLDEPERELFTDLSVFAGPVGLDDITGVLGDRPRLRAGLVGLVDKSLVVADLAQGGTRYRMLETIRAVAGADAVAQLGARHARWFTSVAVACDAALRTVAEPAAAARLGDLTPELRAAHRWSLQHDSALAGALLGAVHQHAYWRLWPEPAGWARDLLALVATGEQAAAAAAVIAGDAANRSRLVEARQFAELGLRSETMRTRASALEVLADVALYEARFEEAAAVAAELQGLGHATGDPHSVAIALVDEALAWLYAGERERAERALLALDSMGARLAPSDAAWASYVRAELAPPAEAAALLEEVVAVAASVQNHLLLSVGQDSLGAALCRAGRLPESLAVLDECLAGFLRHAHYTQTAPAVRHVVEVLDRAGDVETANSLTAGLEELTRLADGLSGRGSGGDRDPHRDLLTAAHAAVRRHRADR